MVTAIVLINVEHGHVNDVAEQLVEMPGIAEVYSVGGRFDLVAIVRVVDNDGMADLVTNHILFGPFSECNIRVTHPACHDHCLYCNRNLFPIN